MVGNGRMVTWLIEVNSVLLVCSLGTLPANQYTFRDSLTG